MATRIKLYQIDLREISKCSIENGKADLAMFMFTTFGCYNKPEEDAIALRAAYDTLRPGGMLIVEQFNPFTRAIDDCAVYSDINRYSDGIGEFFVRLWKTTSVEEICGIHRYFGQYLYCKVNGAEEVPFRCDRYCLSLYCEEWFRTQANFFGASDTIKFYGSFLFEEYNKNSSDLMIVCIRKPVLDNSEETLITDKQKDSALKWLNKVAKLVRDFPDDASGMKAKQFGVWSHNVELVVKHNLLNDMDCFLSESASVKELKKHSKKLKELKWQERPPTTEVIIT